MILALLFLAVPSWASDSRSVRFQHISRDRGLSQSFVYSILQDQNGYMWFGTQEGLNRFDGFEFTVFSHDPENPQSISDETIRTMTEDRSGTLWIGTDAGGLSRYDKASETFTNFLHDPADSESISDNRVRIIYEDRAGVLWIGTDGAGLDRFDQASESFVHYPHDSADSDSLSSNHIWSILEDSNGVLWVATDDGLNKFDSETGTFTHYRHDPSNPASISDNQLRVLYEDQDKELWIGTETGGLNRFDRESDSFERFVHDPADASSISANRINAIFQNDSGVLWIGTIKGLNAWNPDARSFDQYFNDPSDRYSLVHDTVLSIFQDRGDVLWIGTYDGLSRWNRATRAMLHYRNDASDPQSLNENTVTSFTENAAGDIWIGTFGGGLNLLESSTDQFRQLRHDPGNQTSLSSDRVMAVHVDSNGELWAGTRSAGLNRLNADGKTFIRYRHDPEDPASISSDGITYILEDASNGLWIGTFGGGLNFFNRETEQFTQFRSEPSNPLSLSSDRVLVLFEDSLRGLWIGTYGGGLNRLDPDTGTFTQYRAEPARHDGLTSDEIYMIQEDSRGDLWIGVKGGGLNRWLRTDWETGKAAFQRFTELDGLPGSTIYSGVWDQAEHLWLSTSRGLSRLNIESLEFTNYDTSHGLQGDEFNLAAGFQAADGRLFFGGLNGFNCFAPSLLGGNRQAPQVVITSFLSLNKPVDISDTIASGERLQLEFNQNVIGFKFAALDYAAPEKNQYKYKLDGLDQDWIDAGTRRQVTYTNLADGDYTFRVRASNNDGVWSQQDAVLNLYMSPAPWNTWWAYLVYLSILTMSALTIFRANTRRVQQATKLVHAEELNVINQTLQREVAQRKVNEVAAKKEKARTQRYFDVAEVILLTVDADGRVVRINHKGCRLLGAPEAAIVGRKWVDFVPAEYREAVETRLIVTTQPKFTPINNHIEHPLIAADGQEHRISWRFTALPSEDDSSAALCSGMDVTQERSLEKQLEFHEKMSAIATLTGGIAHDFNNLNTVVLTAASMLRSSAVDRLTDLELALVDDTLKSWALPSEDDSSAALCSGMDVTQERSLEKQLEFHEKMSAIATLTGGIAHDFNNLNTVVLTAASMLRSSAVDRLTELELGLVDDTLKAAESSAGVTQRLLAFSHRQILKPIDVLVTKYVTEIEGLIQRTVGDGIVVEITIDAPDLSLRLDTARFTTALINLAANARDAMSGQGELSISFSRVSIGDNDTLCPKLSPMNYIQVMVSDVGGGMNDDELSHAFEPFFSTKDLSVNSGLGLSMVYGFVKQSGGDLRIDSAVHQGTTVTLLVPEHADPATDEAPNEPRRVHFDGRSVLLVEDHDQVRSVTRKLLEKFGFSVTTATNADDAVELIASGNQPDVVLSDLRMPGSLDGRGLAKWVHEQRPEIGVVLTSGFFDKDTVVPENTLALAKPFTNDELGAALQDMLDHRGSRPGGR